MIWQAEDSNYAAGHGDGGRLQSETGMKNEAYDGEAQDDEGPFENHLVFHSGHDIDGINLFLRKVSMGQLFSEDKEDADEGCYNGNNNHRSQIDKEIIEIQMGGRTDHNVRWVADHKSRTAYVAHEDF